MGGAKANFGHKRFHTTPNDVTIEDNLIEDDESEQGLAILTQVFSVLCEAGKTSGWLQYTEKKEKINIIETATVTMTLYNDTRNP